MMNYKVHIHPQMFDVYFQRTILKNKIVHSAWSESVSPPLTVSLATPAGSDRSNFGSTRTDF